MPNDGYPPDEKNWLPSHDRFATFTLRPREAAHPIAAIGWNCDDLLAHSLVFQRVPDHYGAAERNRNVLVVQRDKLGISTMAKIQRLEADGFQITVKTRDGYVGVGNRTGGPAPTRLRLDRPTFGKRRSPRRAARIRRKYELTGHDQNIIDAATATVSTTWPEIQAALVAEHLAREITQSAGWHSEHLNGDREGDFDPYDEAADILREAIEVAARRDSNGAAGEADLDVPAANLASRTTKLWEYLTGPVHAAGLVLEADRAAREKAQKSQDLEVLIEATEASRIRSEEEMAARIASAQTRIDMSRLVQPPDIDRLGSERDNNGPTGEGR